MDIHEINLWERLKEKAVECEVTLKIYDAIDIHDANDHSLGTHPTVEEAYAFLNGYEHSRCSAKLAARGLKDHVSLPLCAKQIRKMKDKNGFIRLVVALEMGELMVPREELDTRMSQWVTGGDGSLFKDIAYCPLGVDDQEHVLVEIVGNVRDWLKEHKA
jgi:hypothetical protein